MSTRQPRNAWVLSPMPCRDDHHDHGPGTEGAGGRCGILGSSAAVADCRQLRDQLSVHRHHLVQSPSPVALRQARDACGDPGEFCPPLLRIVGAVHTTAWIARSHLASAPVALYAAVFVCIDLAYRVFERQAFDQADTSEIPERVRRIARRRSLVTLLIFAAAMLCAIVAPWVGFALICCALLSYLAPELRIFSFASKSQT